VTFADSGRGVVEAEGFASWYEAVEPRLRVALSAAYGPERGREAAAEALAWAWEHLDRLGEIKHPVPYLFRVGRSRTRLRRIRLTVPGATEWSEPWVEPGLARALSSLTPRQRVAVMLVCGHEWTLAEVAELLGVKLTTVQTHMDRGLAKLRAILEVSPDD
jgi:DNA-directed RNA polymerase specialized sigma24 family protein